MPALQSISALGVLLVPVLVRDRERGGTPAMMKTMKLSFALFLLGSACNLALLWGFRLQIFHYLYAGKYAAYASWPLLLVGLLPFAQALPVVLGGGLSALEQPKLYFWSTVGSGAVALAVGVPLAATLGVGGALVGFVVSYVLMGILMLFLLERSMRRERCLIRIGKSSFLHMHANRAKAVSVRSVGIGRYRFIAFATSGC
jgi:O-antigen/teichoic acid export membrane protein